MPEKWRKTKRLYHVQAHTKVWTALVVKTARAINFFKNFEVRQVIAKPL